jgi:DNA-binding SARP family transcriptional activator
VTTVTSALTQNRPRLRLLGGWQLTGAVPPRGTVGENARKLVSLLALRGPMSRARIAETLWPESDGDAAARLRTVLWRLGDGRTLLLEQDGRLSLARDVRVDVDEMRTAALALTNGARDAVAGRLGVETFSADLLPGWDDDWLQIDRERIRQLRLHALEALSMLSLRHGDYGAALDAALAAVLADPLRESAHRCVIETHLAEGNVAEARRQFEQCRRLLARELQVAPSPTLVALAPALGV